MENTISPMISAELYLSISVKSIKRLNNVQHYRKMSNQRMADETREVRQRMSDIIYMSLAGWGEEYEQIRQDD